MAMAMAMAIAGDKWPSQMIWMSNTVKKGLKLMCVGQTNLKDNEIVTKGMPFHSNVVKYEDTLSLTNIRNTH